MTQPARPSCEGRTTYEPYSAQERYIVPLIREAVLGAIAQESARRRGRVLDVGCGGQPFRPVLEMAGYEYHGMDVANPRGIVDYVGAIDAPLCEDLDSAPPFDLILCTEVLEHVADWPVAFVNLYRLLDPGGRIIITAPHVYQLHEEPYDFFRPTPHAIRHHAESCGLRVVRLERLGTGWEVLGTILANISVKPATNSLRSRMSSYWTRKLTKHLSRRLAAGSLQRSTRAQGPLYLTSFAILERP